MLGILAVVALIIFVVAALPLLFALLEVILLVLLSDGVRPEGAEIRPNPSGS